VATNIVFISLTLETFQHKAIAFSTSITMIFNFAFLGTILYRKVGGFDLRYLFISLIKITVASLAMGGLAYALNLQLGNLWGKPRLAGQMAVLGLVILAAGVFYFGLIHWLRIREFREILDKLKERLGRPRPLSS
jgi:putative peptidoglycan lipid II flippase